MSAPAITARQWGLVAACGLGIMMTAIDATAINVALADIQRDLGTSVSSLQLIVNGFTLALVVVVVTMGRLGDLLGLRRVYLWGYLGYALASVICAVSPSDVVLILGRMAMGVTGAILFSLSLALLRAGFSEERQFHWAIGIYATLSAVGLALGPLFGGGLVDLFSWRAIFWANLPLSAIGVGLTLAYVRESSDPDAGRIDLPGVVTLGLGLGAAVLAVIQSSEWGWDSARTIGLLAGGCALLVAFAFVERSARNPIIEFNLFRSRAFVGANAVCLSLFWIVFAFLFLFGLYFQNVEGDSAFIAGVRILPYAVAFMIVAPFVGRVVERFGARATVVAAMLLTTAGVLGLSEVDPGTPAWVIAAFAVLIGIGNVGGMVPVNAAGIAAAPAAKAGLASGILVMARYVGAVIGVAVVGELLDAADGGFVDGMSIGMKVTALVGVAGAAVAALTMKGRPAGARPGAASRLLHPHRGQSPHG